MSGTIIVSAGNARRTLVKLVLTLAATIAVVCLLWPVARPALERVQVQPMWGIENMTGLARSVLVALGAYVIFAILRYLLERILPERENVASLPWRVEEGTLTLDDSAIPLASIRKVHCWPGRNILGQSTGNMVVNIETTGKNRVLRTLSGEQGEESASSLEQLVRALGYGADWDAARN